MMIYQLLDHWCPIVAEDPKKYHLFHAPMDFFIIHTQLLPTAIEVP